jgi:hypothetical protein
MSQNIGRVRSPWYTFRPCDSAGRQNLRISKPESLESEEPYGIAAPETLGDLETRNVELSTDARNRRPSPTLGHGTLSTWLLTSGLSEESRHRLLSPSWESTSPSSTPAVRLYTIDTRPSSSGSSIRQFPSHLALRSFASQQLVEHFGGERRARRDTGGTGGLPAGCGGIVRGLHEEKLQV